MNVHLELELQSYCHVRLILKIHTSECAPFVEAATLLSCHRHAKACLCSRCSLSLLLPRSEALPFSHMLPLKCTLGLKVSGYSCEILLWWYCVLNICSAVLRACFACLVTKQFVTTKIPSNLHCSRQTCPPTHWLDLDHLNELHSLSCSKGSACCHTLSARLFCRTSTCGS